MEAATCPYCGASGLHPPAPVFPAANSRVRSDRGLLAVCICYGVMLGVNAAWGALMSLGFAETAEQKLAALVFIEGVFVAATGVAWWKTRQIAPPGAKQTTRVLAWLGAVPMLTVALGLNCGYHRILTHLFEIPVGEGYLESLESLPLTILVICASPALVEELFFRGVAWKSLQLEMGTAGTLLVSSVMFSMAHIGVPLSMPGLFAVGIVLGCARYWSGGLILPMLLHFFHNLIVVLYPDL